MNGLGKNWFAIVSIFFVLTGFYGEERGAVFNPLKECYAYCKSEVKKLVEIRDVYRRYKAQKRKVDIQKKLDNEHVFLNSALMDYQDQLKKRQNELSTRPGRVVCRVMDFYFKGIEKKV